MSPSLLSADLIRKYAYFPPNEQYRNLFRKVGEEAIQSNRSDAHSAGWLVPDDPTCNPVFVAHSTQSAVWLLREILPESTLSNASWDALAHAACLPTQTPEDTDEPPSAQRWSESPLTLTRSAKRARTAKTEELSEPSPASASSQPDEPANEPDDEPDDTVDVVLLENRGLRHTITSNNRHAVQRREKRRKTEALQKKRAIGLIKPHKEAPLVEHTAYASIIPKDETIVAWIIKQRVADSIDSIFYNTAQTPYTTATTMLQNAYALGNQAAQHNAASFLKSWRSLGTPFPTRAAPSSTPTPSSTPWGIVRRRTIPWHTLSQRTAIDGTFLHAWDAVNYFESQLAAVHIQYHWAMAFLARAYAEKITMLERQDDIAGRGQNHGRSGKGNLRTEAKKALVSVVLPNATSKDYSIFNKRLHRATRWYEAANNLGWGSLCLMPHDRITNTWVEQTLRVGEWRVWLELVKKVNPDVYAAGKAFDSWLGSESIASGLIDGKEPLRIEAELRTSPHEVEEIRDSEDDDEDDLALTESQAVSSVEPAPALRQLTLSELFQPHQRLSQVN